MAQFAEATNEYGDVITSSPGSMPATMQSRWRPAVPLDTAAAYGAPTAAASSSSKRSMVGPSESRPDRSTSSASSSSRSSSQGEERPISRRATLTGLRLGFGGHHVDDVEPVRPLLAATVDGVEIRRLDLLRHRTDAELLVVDGTHRRHLRRGSGHEELVREIEVGADQRRLRDDVAQILCDRDHGVARDPGEDRGRQWRRADHATLDHEDV